MSYHKIIEHYESCLEKHGDTHLGVDWPNKEDAEMRYAIMLDVMNFKAMQKRPPYSFLDFGCGAGHLLDYAMNNYASILYTGCDASEKFTELCRKKYGKKLFPDHLLGRTFDFVVACGVFTEKVSLDYEEMWEHFTGVLKNIWKLANTGIAFNLMSKNVDWERDDLFHVPLDPLTDFLCKNLSRNFVIRNDYGLYEYTVYVYK